MHYAHAYITMYTYLCSIIYCSVALLQDCANVIIMNYNKLKMCADPQFTGCNDLWITCRVFGAKMQVFFISTIYYRENGLKPVRYVLGLNISNCWLFLHISTFTFLYYSAIYNNVRQVVWSINSWINFFEFFISRRINTTNYYDERPALVRNEHEVVAQSPYHFR